MKYLKAIIVGLLLSSCSVSDSSVTNNTNNTNKFTEYLARVTYYWPGESGQYGRQTSTGNIARGGKTVAVDPRIIPYGSKIHIPKMEKVFVAHDTGSAVKKRTASKKVGKNNIVIDIFCESKHEAKKRIAKYPMFMKIKIEPKE